VLVVGTSVLTDNEVLQTDIDFIQYTYADGVTIFLIFYKLFLQSDASTVIFQRFYVICGLLSSNLALIIGLLHSFYILVNKYVLLFRFLEYFR
jgi:hypothetical protein